MTRLALFRRTDPWWDLEGRDARRRRRLRRVFSIVVTGLAAVVVGVALATGWVVYEAGLLPIPLLR